MEFRDTSDNPLVIDSSSGSTPNDISQNLRLVRGILGYTQLGPDAVHAGLIAYSETSNVIVGLTDSASSINSTRSRFVSSYPQMYWKPQLGHKLQEA